MITYTSIIFLLLINHISSHEISIHTKAQNNILDLSDFTFYYKTYHYSLDPLSTESITIYNPDIESNITIQFADTISLIINNNNQSFDILNDNEWTEISLISSIQHHIDDIDDIDDDYNEHEQPSNSNRRRLRRRRRRKNRGRRRKKFVGIRHGKNWNAAKKYCKASRRSHLATIHNSHDNNEVTRECGKMGNRWHCWIGLHRPFKKWVDKSKANYLRWMPGEPNNAGGHEDCTEIYSETGKWNDLKCGHGRAFVCGGSKKRGRGKNKGCNRCGCHRYGCKKRKRSKRKRRRARRRRRRWSRVRREARKRRRTRQRKRAALRRAMRRARRRRKKWRAKLRKLRKKQRAKWNAQYKREMRNQHRRNSAYNLLNKLIRSTLRGSRRGINLYQRRRMIQDEDVEHFDDGYDMIARCRIVRNERGIGKNFEICVNYNFGDRFISVDIRFVDEKRLNMNGNGVDFRGHTGFLYVGDDGVSDEVDVSDYEITDDKGVMFDVIEGSLGYTVWKYDLMDWHNFKHVEDGNVMMVNDKRKYGDYDKFDGLIHYFDEFEFYYNNQFDANDDVFVGNNTVSNYYGGYEYIECSEQIENFPFKMCMKQIETENGKDTLLYFEKDVNDIFDDDATYSFKVKEYIDNRFEENIFHFNSDDNWDEINVIDSNMDMQWMKKCSYKLLIAKVCIEQFHINDSRASIKFQSKHKYISSS